MVTVSEAADPLRSRMRDAARSSTRLLLRPPSSSTLRQIISRRLLVQRGSSDDNVPVFVRIILPAHGPLVDHLVHVAQPGLRIWNG
jgi:hypothetical protein